jgi:DNA-binding transcriptional ArsR family regulator
MDVSAKGIQKILESGDLKTYLDPRLTKAFRHPIREHLLACFSEGITSATRIGEELGLDVSSFYKHVQLLEELGFIEEVDGEQIPARRRRGNKERFFRAKETLLLNIRDTQALPEHLRNDFLASQLISIWGEAVQALRAGTFQAADDLHVTWLPASLDMIAWREAMAVLDHALYRLMEVQEGAAERIAKSSEPSFSATIALLGFGTSRAGPKAR